MAHWNAEIIMPVGAVKGMAFSGEKTAPWNADQGKDIIRQRAGSAHVPGGKFDHDVGVPGWSCQQVALTGRHLG
jgi:hypothetical protein